MKILGGLASKIVFSSVAFRFLGHLLFFCSWGIFSRELSWQRIKAMRKASGH